MDLRTNCEQSVCCQRNSEKFHKHLPGNSHSPPSRRIKKLSFYNRRQYFFSHCKISGLFARVRVHNAVIGYWTVDAHVLGSYTECLLFILILRVSTYSLILKCFAFCFPLRFSVQSQEADGDSPTSSCLSSRSSKTTSQPWLLAVRRMVLSGLQD